MLANYARLCARGCFSGYLLVAAFEQRLVALAGGSFVFVSVLGTGVESFALLFGAVMLGNILGATIGSRVVARLA